MKSKKTNAKRQVVSHTVQPVVGPSEWEGPQFGIWYPYPDIKPRPPRGFEKCECIVYAKWYAKRPVGGTVMCAVFTKTPVGKGRWNDGRHGHKGLTNSVSHWMPMPDGPNQKANRCEAYGSACCSTPNDP